MFGKKSRSDRLPFGVYCRLHGIEGFAEEQERAEHALEFASDERICICVLPVLEDGMHYYLQCNFKREADDIGDFKFVNTLKLLCEQQVLPTLDREHAVDAYLFLDKESLDDFGSQAAHRAIRKKFELVARKDT